MPLLKAKDIIAIIMILGVFIMLAFGVATNFTELLALIVGYYFGHRSSGVESGS